MKTDTTTEPMTDAEINVAIAEACPPRLFVIHKPVHDPFGYYRPEGKSYTVLADAWKVPEEIARKYIGGRPTDSDRVIMEPAPIPDYCHDLNAMHETEAQLDACDPDTRSLYSDYLTLMHAELFEKEQDGLKRDPFDREWALIRSTARQRAEAFLRCMNLWKPPTS